MGRAVKVFSIAILLSAFAVLGRAQSPATQTAADADAKDQGQAFYLKLRSVGLNKSQVYKIREASLDRAQLHISLDDGTIAFTEAVDGHITGAFYQGYGEVLLMPPNQSERASMSLFTGSAILEETFSDAYFRFSDDVFGELQPYLRQADDPDGFVTLWGSTAKNLAEEDALRLLLSYSECLPGTRGPTAKPTDRMLHAYVQGNQLGAFDVRYDSLLREQVAAGQHRHVEGEDYYDMWASLTVPAPAGSAPISERSKDDEPSAVDFDISNFKIDARIKPVKELEAKATLSVIARQRTRRVMFFELSRFLRVSEVLADGKPVEFIHNQAVEGSHLAKQGNDAIAVILPDSLEKGRKLELTFKYSGSVL
jgi:hypothetical protein